MLSCTKLCQEFPELEQRMAITAGHIRLHPVWDIIGEELRHLVLDNKVSGGGRKL